MNNAELPNRSFYSFEHALDARFRISCEGGAAAKIRSAVYIHERDFPLLMHSHNFYEINIVTEGTGTHFIESNSFPAQTGDVFVIPPNISHGYSEDADRSLKILHILLSRGFMLEYDQILKGIEGYSLLFNIEPQLRKDNNIKIFANINNAEFIYYLHEIGKLVSFCEGDMTDGVNETNKNVKILNLISDLAIALTLNNEISAKNSPVNLPDLLQVLSYIEDNFAETVTLSDLCRVSNMSRSSLLKQFHRLCRCSPSDYLLNTRVENACKMLEHSDHSIAQIAQDCGFYDSSHFSKMFCKVKKMLPKDYRSSVKSL